MFPFLFPHDVLGPSLPLACGEMGWILDLDCLLYFPVLSLISSAVLVIYLFSASVSSSEMAVVLKHPKVVVRIEVIPIT